MSIISLPYSPVQIEKIHQELQSRIKSNEAIEFEIQADDKTLVKRTADIRKFKSFFKSQISKPQVLAIIIYEIERNTSSRYQFYTETNQLQYSQEQESITNIDKMIEDRLQKERMHWEMTQLINENNILKDQLKTKNQEITVLKTNINSNKEQSPKAKKLDFEALATDTFENIILSNVQEISKIKGFESFGNIIANDISEANQAQESEVTFKKAEKPDTYEIKINEQRIAYVKYLESNFNKEQLIQIAEITQLMTARKDAITPTIDFIKNYK
ncbi:MAG: hypothetical protein WCK02_01620 [Bacteroidota bacterium]